MATPLKPEPDWQELTRASVAKHVHRPKAEECYVMLVLALAQQAEEARAVPRDVAVAFERAPGKWQKADVPTTPPLKVMMRATFNGEWHEYEALLPDDYDPLWLRTIQ